MNEWLLVYLLSVMSGFGILACLGMVFGLMAGGLLTVIAAAESAEAEDEESERWKRDHTQRAKRLRAIARPALIVGALCTPIALLVPSRRDLIESYVIVQASKVATAENAQAAVDGAMRRIDALIERLGK